MATATTYLKVRLLQRLCVGPLAPPARTQVELSQLPAVPQAA